MSHCQGNANPDHEELGPPTCQKGECQRQEMAGAREDAGKGEPPALLVGMQAGVATWENSMAGPQKMTDGNTGGSVVTLLDIHPKT